MGFTSGNGNGRFWGFSPIGLNGVFECILKIEMYSTRAWKFDDISVQTAYQWNHYLFFFLRMYFVMRPKLAFMTSLLKCNSDFIEEIMPCCNLAARLTSP